MIIQTLHLIVRRIILLAIIFTLVFPNIMFAQVWTPPTGAPPNNNAPAPIHEGTTGQGKYWSSFANLSLGSLYNTVEGLISGWGTADEEGFGATQFCLVKGPSGFDYFPTNITGGISAGALKCIDFEDGWGSGGGGTGEGGEGGEGGGTGEGVPNTAFTYNPTDNTLTITDTAGSVTSPELPFSDIPDGTIRGQSLFWDNLTQQWKPHSLFRTTFTSSNNANEGTGTPGATNENNFMPNFIMGNWPDAIYQSTFGHADPVPGPVLVSQDKAEGRAKFGLNGEFFYRQTTGNGDISVPTIGKILGSTVENKVSWVDPATYIAGLGMPQGTSTGQVLYWGGIAAGYTWQLTQGVRLTPDAITFAGSGGAMFGEGSALAFFNNLNKCPANSGGSILKVTDISAPGFFPNVFDVRCNGAIKIKNVVGDANEEVVLTNVAVLNQNQKDQTVPRNLCYTSQPYSGIDAGTLVDCEPVESGTLIVKGPIGPNPWTNPTTDYTVEEWDVPFGVTSVSITSCAGGGGGGGGAGGQPKFNSSLDKTGGGGGGGGGAGQCTEQVLPLTEPNLAKLRISVGRGGNYGNQGITRCAYTSNLQGTESTCDTWYSGSNNGDNATSGGNGYSVSIQKISTSGSIISTPINLVGGIGGGRGRTQCAVTSSQGGGWECGAFGGIGGKGGGVPTIIGNTAQNIANRQSYSSLNGQHARENNTNNAGGETLLLVAGQLGYYSGFCSNGSSMSSCGGTGGIGQSPSILQTSSLGLGPVFPNYLTNGSGGQGGEGCSSCNFFFNHNNGMDTYFYSESSSGLGGNWGQGGGGGGGAHGRSWIDYNSGSGFSYESRGSIGGRGGPGYVRLSW